MFRRVFLALLAFAFATSAWADARDELHAAFLQSLTLKSFRATMLELPSNKVVSTVEFVAPDRFRVTPSGQAASLMIGDTMYLQAGGRSMKIPLPKNMLGKYRNEAVMADLEKGAAVESLGAGMVGAQAARKYRFTTAGKQAATSTVWVAVSNGRVLQLETSGKAAGKPVSMRIRYSDFNSPAIRIDVPR